MGQLNLGKNSAWDEAQIVEYLDGATTPLRLACVGGDGFPVVCSLWFHYTDGEIWSVTHEKSHIISILKSNPNVGLEVGTNDYPYRGVRGKAVVELHREPAEQVLRRLIKRYLGDSNRELADWLLGRADEEIALRIRPQRISSWDFSNRMQSASAG